MTIGLLAKGFVLSGVVILGWALFKVRALIDRLPDGPLRRRWYVLAALIVMFVAGYIGYAALFWSAHRSPVDLVVPAVFFFGACFVWLTAVLSLNTAVSIMRISVLEQETFTDPLTGLFNRRFLDQRLSEELASARRYGIPLSVLMIDIDHFKKINDSFGHQTGDEVLVSVANTLSAELRDSDVIVRFGGEEFLVIAPHTPVENAVGLAERLRAVTEAQDVRTLRGSDGVQFTISVGVATFNEAADTAEALVEAADGNLYRAKNGGRNQVVADT